MHSLPSAHELDNSRRGSVGTHRGCGEALPKGRLGQQDCGKWDQRVGRNKRSALRHLPAQSSDCALQGQISRSPFKLACPSLPTMMWSCTAMPSGFATSMIALVMSMSAREGVGSPLG